MLGIVGRTTVCVTLLLVYAVVVGAGTPGVSPLALAAQSNSIGPSHSPLPPPDDPPGVRLAHSPLPPPDDPPGVRLV